MMNAINAWHRLEINGGTLHGGDGRHDSLLRLQISANDTAYSDAQIDDYGHARRRRAYPWIPGTQLSLRARFSHPPSQMLGTAGFGFWNAPFGDPTMPWPTLPQAVWFFWGSPPNHLPFFPDPPGHGGYANTLDATRSSALALAPWTPLVLLLQSNRIVRRRLWPWVQRRLAIRTAPIPVSDTLWHLYQLQWNTHTCSFWLDGRLLLHAPYAPRGPLGFVCWIDNQYLTLTPWGKIGWGIIPTTHLQWLEVAEIAISQTTHNRIRN
jgi:hypothetical protein